MCDAVAMWQFHIPPTAALHRPAPPHHHACMPSFPHLVSPQVVAFVKGTRTQPQCGFSYKVLTLLQEVRPGSAFDCAALLPQQALVLTHHAAAEALRTISAAGLLSLCSALPKRNVLVSAVHLPTPLLLPSAAQSGAEFEVVNVLDEVYNPGLREAIKTYSAWPTIPQARMAWPLLPRAALTERSKASASATESPTFQLSQHGRNQRRHGQSTSTTSLLPVL